ncbi:hypothetical protein [Bacillus sp. P14.5]|uniref:hypothetical protein n=1 Tax=Bacillus sp. P14.5 TaxID=1983400 RepID=UPI000DE81EB4|nr:hypothetical protein [Bacillus sp. P14.5]
MKEYVLNLNVQPNGDYEVHSKGCRKEPTLNVEKLGYHMSCNSAVNEAKRKHPRKKINGCIHCSRLCHTS